MTLLPRSVWFHRDGLTAVFMSGQETTDASTVIICCRYSSDYCSGLV